MKNAKKLIAVLAVCILSALTLTSCDLFNASYKVVFEADGEIRYETVVKNGEGFAKPENPAKDGYIFAGWSCDGAEEAVFTEEEIKEIIFKSQSNRSFLEIFEAILNPNKEIIFTAVWDIAEYSITYVLDGGINHADNPTGYSVGSGAITLQNPKRERYKFLGFAESADGTPVLNYIIAGGTTGNITVYAKWEATEYSIVYVLDGGTNHAENPTGYTVESGDIVLQAPTREGYNFLGFADSADGTPTPDYVIMNGTTGDLEFTANWSEIIYTEGLQFTAIEGGYEVGFGSAADTNIIIPPTYDGGSVIRIADNGFMNKRIISVIIPDGVISIGNYAFRDCRSLTEIVIPDSVISIGNNAFRYCNILPEVIFGNGLTTIGNFAFEGCNSLTKIAIPDSVISIGNGAFWYCRSLTKIVISDSVISIGNDAFSYCVGLTEIVIGDGVTAIGDSAFIGCDALESITVGDGNAAYASVNGVLYNKAKTEILKIPRGNEGSAFEIPYGVTAIGNRAFYNCTGLTEIVIPDSVTSIGNSAFDSCVGLTEIVIPDSVMSIGDFAFSDCKSLTKIAIPDGVTTIGYGAFHQCTGLTEIAIPDGVTSIGDFAFYGCTGLTEIIIPDGVTGIGNSAFLGCTGLTEIVLPDGVTSIGDFAFRNCTGLTEFVIPDGVTAIANGVFYECGGLTKIVIPDGVTSIGNSAFGFCVSLTEIVIPDGVTTIGASAFYGCTGLTEIVIPEGVTAIGDSAFSGCTGLTIYARATAKPSDWSSDWNYSNRPVVWGYEG